MYGSRFIHEIWHNTPDVNNTLCADYKLARKLFLESITPTVDINVYQISRSRLRKIQLTEGDIGSVQNHC